MEINVSAKKLTVSSSTRAYAAEFIGNLVRGIDKVNHANVVISKGASGCKVELLIRGKGIDVSSHASAENHYKAFDKAGDKISRQLEKIVSVRRSHKGRHLGEIEADIASVDVEPLEEYQGVQI